MHAWKHTEGLLLTRRLILLWSLAKIIKSLTRVHVTSQEFVDDVMSRQAGHASYQDIVCRHGMHGTTSHPLIMNLHDHQFHSIDKSDIPGEEPFRSNRFARLIGKYSSMQRMGMVQHM